MASHLRVAHIISGFVLFLLLQATDLPAQALPGGFNDYFAGSGECVLCHANQVNNAGQSVSIVNDWRSSMMAHSSKDPFWRAKVSHETLVNPQHAAVLEDVCTRCHAPVGHFNAHLNGGELYSIAALEADPLARDGVSCTVCHQVKAESLGNYSGNMLIGENKQIWGPYPDPFPNPMISHTGFTPVEGQHILDSRLCGSCHTLITNTVDLSGMPTGDQFVEQAIYHEWLNSDLAASGTSCQDCHMQQIPDEVVISTMPPWLGPRSPFGLHHLAGANVFMLKLLKENSAALGITATAVQLDSTIARAQRMLLQHALLLELEETGRTADSLFVEVTLKNMTGHKFPSGYPSRRAFVVFTLTGPAGDTLFCSGRHDGDFELLQEDPAYEPHWNVIDDEEKVQVYELVMGDVNLDPTTVLERAFVPLKDNRIPPPGFTTAHPSYDTVAIAGEAVTDPDFNILSGMEGAGADVVHYRVPTGGAAGDITVSARVYYQTVSGKWLQAMFEYSSDPIDAFKGYYDAADKQPVLVASAGYVSSLTADRAPLDPPFKVSPNPASGIVHISGAGDIREAAFYDLHGRRYDVILTGGSDAGYLASTPPVKGVTILRFTSGRGETHTCKVLLD